MRFLVVLLSLALPAFSLAQDDPAQPEPLPESGGTGKAMLTIENGRHVGAVRQTFLSHDGKQIISIGVDKTVRIWDAKSGESLKVLRLSRPAQAADSSAYHIKAALSPDNKTLAIGGAEARLVESGAKETVVYALLLNLETGQTMQLPGFKKTLESMRFSRDGNQLAIYGPQSRPAQEKKKGAAEPPVPEKKLDPVVCVWSGLKDAWSKGLQGPTELAVPKFHHKQKGTSPSEHSEVSFSAGANRLALTLHRTVRDLSKRVVSERMIILWQLDNPSAPTAKVHVNETGWSSFSPDGSLFVVTAMASREANVWSSEDGKLLRTLKLRAGDEFLGLGFQSDHELLLTQRKGAVEKPADPKKPISPKKPADPKKPVDAKKPVEPKQAVAVSVGLWDLKQGTVKDLAMKVEPPRTPNPVLESISQDQTRAKFSWSKQGHQLAWTVAPKIGPAAAVDLTTLEQLPTVSPANFIVPKNPTNEMHFGRSADGLHFHHLTDNIVRIKAKDNRQTLLYMYTAGQDWVVWTAEGYYAASPGGEKVVGWHVDNGDDKLATFYPVDRFRKQLYRPDIIKLVIEKYSVAEAVKAANAAAGIERTRDVKIDELLPPRAVLSVLQQDKAAVKLKVHAEASAKEQPVTGLRLLIDGRPLADGSANERFGDGKAKADAEWSVTLPPGPHQLTVLARSPDASSKSNSIEVVVADPAKQNTLHVLAIGVNDYEDSTLKLDFAAKDAQDIAASFQKNCKGELFTDVRGETLVNAGARKDAVLKQLAELRNKVNPNDLVVIFFAGHGVKEKDKFYLLPVEAKTTDLAKTAISGEELRKSLGEFPCQVLLMLDACHSSGSLKSFRPAVDDITRNLTDDDCGVAVMCAAMAHEKALEKSGNGLFTRAVVQALGRAEGVPFNRYNRLMYVDHLHTFVRDEVMQQSGDRQHPFLSLPWVVESFPVTKFAAK